MSRPKTFAAAFTKWADEQYRTRFERRPKRQPWRSQWDRVERFHKAALDGGDLRTAYLLAERRYAIELESQGLTAGPPVLPAATRPKRMRRPACTCDAADLWSIHAIDCPRRRGPK